MNSLSQINYRWFANGEMSSCLLISSVGSGVLEHEIAVLTQLIALKVRDRINSDTEIIPCQESITLVCQQQEQLILAQNLVERCFEEVVKGDLSHKPKSHQINVCYDKRLGGDLAR